MKSLSLLITITALALGGCVGVDRSANLQLADSASPFTFATIKLSPGEM